MFFVGPVSEQPMAEMFRVVHLSQPSHHQHAFKCIPCKTCFQRIRLYKFQQGLYFYIYLRPIVFRWDCQRWWALILPTSGSPTGRQSWRCWYSVNNRLGTLLFLKKYISCFLSLCLAERIFNIWGKYVFAPKILWSTYDWWSGMIVTYSRRIDMGFRTNKL